MIEKNTGAKLINYKSNSKNHMHTRNYLPRYGMVHELFFSTLVC